FLPPEVLLVVDHALDDGSHGHPVDELVPQRGQLRAEVDLQVQPRRDGQDHILTLCKEEEERGRWDNTSASIFMDGKIDRERERERKRERETERRERKREREREREREECTQLICRSG